MDKLGQAPFGLLDDVRNQRDDGQAHRVELTNVRTANAGLSAMGTATVRLGEREVSRATHCSDLARPHRASEKMRPIAPSDADSEV